MARKPNTHVAIDSQPFTPSADDAFAAHSALIRAEHVNPALSQNAYWRALREAAFARFRATMEAL